MEKQLKRQKRAKEMLPGIKDLITLRALQDTGKDRNTLAEQLLVEIKSKFPKEIPPVIETIIKKISEARNPEKDPLGEQWHLGAMSKYPISSETIPFILKIRKDTQISIRQAIWISRLCKVITNLEILEEISFQYALHERVSEISGTHFDTTDYDSLLLDSKSQKELLKQFKNLENNLDWSMLKKVHQQILHPLHEGSRYVRFTGNQVFGIGVKDPDFYMGNRDEFIKSLKDDGFIKKSAVLPEGDFIFRLPDNVVVAPGHDEIPSKEDK